MIGVMPMITRRRVLSLACCGGLASATLGLPQTAKSQLLRGVSRIMVGFPAGGNTDFVARLLAKELKDYSSTVIVENRSGASGRLALDGLKSSAADGLTMALTPAAMIVLFPHIYKTLKYDALADFVPVSLVCRFPYLLIVGPMVPDQVKTFADFIVWCRAYPKLASFGTLMGTPMHFTGFMLSRLAHLEILHVPYQGVTAAVQNLMGGQIAAAVVPVDIALPEIRSGKLRALATTGPLRSPFLPDVPTAKEAGYPSLEFVDWFGVFLPAKTPAETVGKLNDAIREALKKEEIKAAFARISYEVAATSGSDFAQLIKSDFERWGPIVKASGYMLED
jgi:tripartite-type tricarboxylate transporter receptor subunit TctC